MAGPLQQLLAEHTPLILDGAMGSELDRRGIDSSLPLWSARALMANPAAVLQIHKEYLDAGADIITTNTFRTTRRSFRRAGLSDRSLGMTVLAVQLAKEARLARGERRTLLAGSMAPLEDCYRPDLVPSDRELRLEHGEHAYRLAAAGVDCLILETIGTIREAFAACEAAVGTGLEVIVSFLCRTDGALYGGETLEDAVNTIEPFGPAVFSLNCAPVSLLDGLLKELRSYTELPLAVYGNVGRPGGEQETQFFCDVDPDRYAACAAEWARLGASIIGGCCGTTPEFIRRMRDRLRGSPPQV